VLQQQQVDSVLMYLWRHGQHIGSINLRTDGTTLTLRWLPKLMQLSSLQLGHMTVQLHLRDGWGLTVGPPPLKQLCLSNCKLLDTAEEFAAALVQLPTLEHLSVQGASCTVKDSNAVQGLVPTHTLASVLQQLQHLTHLQLDDLGMFPSPAQIDLQQLQALTQLADLRLGRWPWGSDAYTITATMLSGAHQLTRLETPLFDVEPGALAGKTQLQHLHLNNCTILGEAAGVAELLSHLKHMQQLTYLDLQDSLQYDWVRDASGDVLFVKQERRSSGDNRVANPPAAAFAALTASSKLQHLNISCCSLPSGVWTHIFPAGRQLLHLHHLDIGDVHDWLVYPTSVCTWDPPLEGNQLVSCCPGLHSLKLANWPFRKELLAPLRALSGLHTLCVSSATSKRRALEVVCRLTGLRALEVWAPCATHPGLLELIQLKQLTRVCFTTENTRAVITQVRPD
jgi:hypothetical protein